MIKCRIVREFESQSLNDETNNSTLNKSQIISKLSTTGASNFLQRILNFCNIKLYLRIYKFCSIIRVSKFMNYSHLRSTSTLSM